MNENADFDQKKKVGSHSDDKVMNLTKFFILGLSDLPILMISSPASGSASALRHCASLNQPMHSNEVWPLFDLCAAV